MTVAKEQDKPKFIGAKEVAETIGCSESHAYKIIRQLNDDLRAKGMITKAGKISRRYFEERTYM